MTTLINNLEADFLRDRNVDSKITEKQTLQETKWSKAFELFEKAEKCEEALKLAQEEHDKNAKSIMLWKQQIKELQKQISQTEDRQKVLEVMSNNEANEELTQSVRFIDEARGLKDEITVRSSFPSGGMEKS